MPFWTFLLMYFLEWTKDSVCIVFLLLKKKNPNPKDGNFKIGYGFEAMVNSYKNCLGVDIQDFCSRLIITESRTDMTVIAF